MKCDAYRILIREREAGTFEPDEIEFVERHLQVCESCRAFQDGLHASADGSSGGIGAADGAGGSAARPGRSWVWAAAAVIALVVTIAVLLAVGGRGRLHRPGGHGASCARTAAGGHR